MYLTAIRKFFINHEKENIVSPLFGTNHLIMISICLIFIASLFIFRNTYAKFSKYHFFSYFLGFFQLSNYIIYYVAAGLSGNITSWTEYMPFHMSGILIWTSSLVLFFPIERLFNVTFSWIGPVFLTFLLPDDSRRRFAFDSYFFYYYYLNHLITVYSYFYLYLYGHFKYVSKNLKYSISFLFVVGVLIFFFNNQFNTNYMFTGTKGYSIFSLETGLWHPILRLSFMAMIGIFFVCIFHFLITYFLPPYYFYFGKYFNPIYHSNFLQRVKRYKKQNSISKKIIGETELITERVTHDNERTTNTT